jgi:hypothetical protein
MSGTKAYKVWRSMISRCYSEAYHVRKPTYRDCEVGEDWKLFSNFLIWFSDNYIQGWELDKDCHIKGNKLYSEQTCVFLPSRINSFFIKVSTIKSDGLPLGVTFKKANRKYIAQISLGVINGTRKSRHIIISDSVEECLKAYTEAKKQELASLIDEYRHLLDCKALLSLEEFKF